MSKKRNIPPLAAAALTAALLAGCAGDSPSDIAPTPSADNTEIKVNADVWQVMDGTRATTFDNADALQTEGSFKTYAFFDGSTTQYISGSTVNYVTDHWEFADGKHYWPPIGSLNFFAHMPGDLTNTHCSFDPTEYHNTDNLDGYSEDIPRIKCENLPVTSTGQSTLNELVCAYKASQSKSDPGASGVILNFIHPFARIYFKTSAASATNVTINSITISDIYNNGICTFDGAASPQTSTWATSGSTTSFECTEAISSSDVTRGPYLVIPQEYGNLTFTVNATWSGSDWSNFTPNLSTTVTVNWQPGHSYTYTLTLSPTVLEVDVTKYTEQW